MFTLTYYLRVILFCILSFLHLEVYTQKTDVIIRLEKALEEIVNDTNKVDTLNELAWEYSNGSFIDLEEAQKNAEKGLSLAQRIDFHKGAADSWNRLGNVGERKGNYEDALNAYRQALPLDSLAGNIYGMGRDYHQIAVMYQRIGKFQAAIDYELKSIDIFKKLPESKRNELALSNVYNSIGNAYKHQANYKIALEYFQNGLRLRKKWKSPFNVSKSLNEIGTLYELLGMFRLSINYYQQSLETAQSVNYGEGMANAYQNLGNIYAYLGKSDNAADYYQRSLQIRNLISDEPDYQDLMHSIGVLFIKKEEYDSALKYLEKSLIVRESLGNKVQIAETNFYIGRTKSKQGKLEEAKSYLEKSASLAKGESDPALKTQILEELAEVYSLLDNGSEAFRLSVMVRNITDSLTNEKMKASEYQQELRLLEVELEKAKNKVLTTQFFLVGGLLSALLIFLIILITRNRKIAKQEVKIREKEIDELIRTQELNRKDAILEGQDSERAKIAKDLHDQLGGVLTVVKLNFKSIEENIHRLEAQNREQYAMALKMLNEASEKVRRFSHDIGGNILNDLGLIPTIEDLATTIEASKKLTISVINSGFEERFNYEVEKNIFKIIQEVLSNILKHAAAETVEINLTQDEEVLLINIEDDGKGFDIESPNYKEGMGMVSIRSRVKKLHGQVDIDSRVGRGTIINLEIPYKQIDK